MMRVTAIAFLLVLTGGCNENNPVLSVISTNPAAGAADVAVDVNVSITFSDWIRDGWQLQASVL